jgi:hypothetical protein
MRNQQVVFPVVVNFMSAVVLVLEHRTSQLCVPACVLAARWLRQSAATALLTEGETFDIDKLEREKLWKRQDQDEADYQGLERSVLAGLGLDPDTYVVQLPVALPMEEVPNGKDTRRSSSVNVDSVRISMSSR